MDIRSDDEHGDVALAQAAGGSMRKLLVVLIVLFSAGVLSSCSLLPFGNVFAAELLEAHYTVSAGGEDYWLVFKDFTMNDTIDPDNVGLYGLGVAPWSENPQTGPAQPLFAWAGSIHMEGVGEKGYPGVFVPQSK